MDPLTIKVWGDLACFTPPEGPYKVERVSYPVPTPSAMRGVLDSIFCKIIEGEPAMRWHIAQIQVLRPIQTVSFTRSELTKTNGPLDITAKDTHTLRQTRALKDVAYIIVARIEVLPIAHPRMEEPAWQRMVKYRDQAVRRVRTGRCFQRPYLGCKEFPAYFGPVDGSEQPIDVTMDLGRMVYDLEYPVGGAGRISPHFYDARLERGVVHVPSRASVMARTASHVPHS